MIDLASMLIFQREQRGLSLRKAAKGIGISNAFLSQLETGKQRNPTLSVIQKITRAYRIKPDVWMQVQCSAHRGAQNGKAES